jgi:hypothetical protein
MKMVVRPQGELAVLMIGMDSELRYQQLVPEVGQEPDYGAALTEIRKLL